MSVARMFPQDTRLAEIAAAWALVFLGAAIALSNAGWLERSSFSALTSYQHAPFWAVMFVSLGALQIYAVAAYPHTDILRVILAWMSGSLWIWVALSSNGGFVYAPDPAALTLGLANMYAFIVNAMLLRSKWTN